MYDRSIRKKIDISRVLLLLGRIKLPEYKIVTYSENEVGPGMLQSSVLETYALQEFLIASR